MRGLLVGDCDGLFAGDVRSNASVMLVHYNGSAGAEGGEKPEDGNNATDRTRAAQETKHVTRRGCECARRQPSLRRPDD